MNWYKQAQRQVINDYNKLLEQAISSIEIVGSGKSESLSIPGASQTITANDLLQRVKQRIGPILMENHVTQIDTSPISKPNAQGLAISHEPGKIFVDVRKIFESARQALPPTVQLDGTQPDPDAANSIIARIGQWIEEELTETSAHESFHSHDFVDAFQNKQPFNTVHESPAQQFGKKIRQRIFPNTEFKQ